MRRAGWPKGLIERKGYYSWRSPVDGREYGIGRDKSDAIAQVIEANIHAAGMQNKRRLVDVLDGGEKTVGRWLDRFEKELAKRNPAINTAKTNRWRVKMARELLGEALPLARISTETIALAIESIEDQGKSRSAQSMRSFFVDMFNGAIAAGWWTSPNPVTVTRAVNVEIKRGRLSWDAYQAIYKAAGQAWIRNAMDLALVSAQRREDIAGATFADFKSDGWYFKQGKTGKKLILPLELRLNVLGKSLGDVMRQCRASGVLSKFLIHQTTPTGNSAVGERIFIDTISKGFARVRDSLDMDWGDKGPPTFHEIRSLSERLYASQGNINTQELLGHESPEMTRMYHDTRGAEWTRVKVG